MERGVCTNLLVFSCNTRSLYLLQINRVLIFTETLLVVPKNEAQEIESKLSQVNLNIKINYLTINPVNEDHLGTVDALRRIHESINSDVLILSCDSLGDFDLVPFINQFRQQSPSLLILACRGNVASVIRCYGSKNQLEKDIIGLDTSNRIVIFNSESDFERNVTLTQNELNSSPDLTIHNNLLDGHVYLMKKGALDHLLKEESISSLKGELLPSLVQMQFSRDTARLDKDLFEEECLKFEPASGPLRGLLLSDKSRVGEESGCITCYAHLHRGYIIRANTLMGYIEANKRLVLDATASQEEAKTSSKSCIMDASSSLGANVSVVRSVIGANCKVGNKVKIVDSVIMDGVSVEDGCCISNTVVCPNATLGKGCQVDMCLVIHAFSLESDCKVVGELLAEGSDVDIEDL